MIKLHAKQTIKRMIYGSVCSGIEAASVAWEPLGWEPAWFSEIEKFPSQVLAHRWPSVPNLGDMTLLTQNKIFSGTTINLLVGGTPCQSFSIAGLRGGLADDRGNLALEYCRLLIAKQPRWFVWENVPGVFTSFSDEAESDEPEVWQTADFATLLAAFQECGYSVAWRVFDSQYFGVPQRRRRVFVVGYLGNDWRPPFAVLFERESLRRDFTPRREARKETAGPAAVSVKGDCAHTLKARGFDGSEDGTGRGVPIVVPINTQIATRHKQLGERTGFGVGEPGEPAFTLQSAHSHAVGCWWDGGQTSQTLDAVLHKGQTMPEKNRFPAVIQPMYPPTVRKLTPLECERLQGFPDNYTNIPGAKDGPRYKALGNSMTVNVMRWIGERINTVDKLIS